MAVAEQIQVKRAEFGAPLLSDVNCRECYDTGLSGGSQYTAGTRCEACRGPGAVTRFIRAIGLGEFLAASPREL
jgi:DnaJ-class molecular chaperone